jgi:hypothetical protein
MVKTRTGGKCVEDWLKIKTEYITTDISYRKLAEKYGVSKAQIYKIGGEEHWVELREQFRSKTIAKTVDKIVEKKARQAARVGDLADKLMIKLEQAIDELDLQVTTHKIKTERGSTEETTEFRVAVPGGTVDRTGLRQLTGALKELKLIKDEISDLERREREARIEVLRRQAEKGDTSDSSVIVQLEGVEEYAL